MLRTVLAVAAIAIGVTAVAAQSDPIAARKGLMKNMGAATKTGGQMAKGEVPYDQAKAQEIFATYIDVAARCPTCSRRIPRPAARPRRRRRSGTTMAGFKAGFAKISTEAKAAQAVGQGPRQLQGAFGGLTKNCGGCHETYRVKKS